MKRRLSIISALVICLLSTTASASTLSNKKNELANTKENLSESKEALKEVKAAKEELESEVDALDSKIVKAENELLTIETDLENKKAEVETAQVELDEAVVKKDFQYEATKERMVQMYKNKKKGYMELVFSSGSLSELLNRTKYIQVISQYDNQVLDEYKRQEQVIAEKKLRLETEQTEIEGLYDKQVATRDSLETMRSDKNKKLNQKKAQEGSLHAQIEEFEKISKDLEAEIKKLTQKSTMKYTGGKFAWPVPGYYRISSEYNPRENPISGKAEFHQGIDIPAAYGQSVVAAADGVVITAGWVRGFGNTVMVDHGSGIVTIYGHNSSVVVSTGQKVSKGQQVARIGSTGYSTGNHCHFEVRKNGVHTNPWAYLNK